MLSMLSSIEPQFRRSSQQQLLIEMLLVRFALLDRSISLEEVLKTLGGGGTGPGGTGGGGTGGGGSGGGGTTGSRTSSGGSGAARSTPSPRTSSAPQSTHATAARDLPAEPVATPPTPPLRVTPAAEQNAVRNAPDWKAEFDQMANSAERTRLTTESVRLERLARLRAQDPVLDAAVRELDLDLLD
jgi:hypothetical protein